MNHNHFLLFYKFDTKYFYSSLGSLFIHSFLEALKSVSAWVFSSLSATIGIFSLYYSYNKSASILSSILVGASCFTIVLLFVTGKKFVFKRRMQKKSKGGVNVYGDAIIMLSDAFARIHDLRNKLNSEEVDVDAYTIRQVLVSVCDSLKKWFDKKSHGTTSVCIKVISCTTPEDITDRSFVINFCRDSKHEIKRKNGESDQHQIYKNTSFLEIFNYLGKDKGEFYLNNNLPSDLRYENTSIGIYGDPLPEKANNEASRTKDWHLPYQSELVVPIRPKIDPASRGYKLLGFLCVDCNVKHVFNLSYDVEMLRGVSDGITDIMEVLYTKLKHAPEN